MTKNLLAAALLTLTLPAAAGTVYKCTDPKTRDVSYSMKPCAAGEQTKLNTDSSTSSDAEGRQRLQDIKDELRQREAQDRGYQAQPQPASAAPAAAPAAKERKTLVKTGNGWEYKTDAQLAADEERRQRKPTVCTTSGSTTSGGYTSGVAICR